MLSQLQGLLGRLRGDLDELAAVGSTRVPVSKGGAVEELPAVPTHPAGNGYSSATPEATPAKPSPPSSPAGSGGYSPAAPEALPRAPAEVVPPRTNPGGGPDGPRGTGRRPGPEPEPGGPTSPGSTSPGSTSPGPTPHPVPPASLLPGGRSARHNELDIEEARADPLVGPMLDGYDPYNGLSREEWYERYWDPTKRNGRGGWNYPENNGRDPASVAIIEIEPGTSIDRFGAPDGRYLPSGHSLLLASDHHPTSSTTDTRWCVLSR